MTETPPTRERRDMAVLVMRDVIAQIEDPVQPLNVLSRNGYIRVPDVEFEVKDTRDLREILPAIRPNCEVCMLGAMVLSKAGLFDKVNAAELFGDDILPGDDVNAGKAECCLALSDVFDRGTLDLLETTFEANFVRGNDPSSQTRAVAFGRNYDDDRQRAIAIARNVIANDGLFVP